MQCRLPVFEWHSVTIAVLLCSLARTGDLLGLVLTPDPTARDPTRHRYHVGTRYRNGDWTRLGVLRLISLGSDLNTLRFDGEVVRPQWHTVYIDRKSTRLNSSHSGESRMPSSA